MQNSKWLFEAVRGMPTMMIPGFALQHALISVSCASSSSVKSHVSSNKATPRKATPPNAPHIRVFVLHSQLGISFRPHFIDISFNGQTHPARDRLRRLRIEHHAIGKPFRNVKKALSPVLSNSSRSAISMSPFQVPPAYNAYPRNNPGKAFFPN